jgi:hypothetical protein
MNTESEDSNFLVRELQRCPLWTRVPESDIKRRREITRIYLRLAQYNTETLRAGIASYLNSYAAPLSYEYYEASDKVFVFLRVVFDVPRRFDATKERLPFGLQGNPVYPDGVDLLWPFSIDTNGDLQLTGVDLGVHSGPSYDALADFDHMASRLRRRFPASR